MTNRVNMFKAIALGSKLQEDVALERSLEVHR